MTPIEFTALFLVVLLIAGGTYHLFAFFCVVAFFRKGENVFAKHLDTPVSILKPLKGSKPELRENLRSFCLQKYPEYEVLLGFGDQADGGIPLARELVLAFDDRPLRIVASENNLGANRKVSNLQGLYAAASHTMLLISDSDMRIDPFYLRNIVGEYFSDKKARLVTSLYKVSDPKTIGAALESLVIALDFIPSVLAARRLEGVTFGLGAAMLISKKSIEDIGGFRTVADYLADDYQIGNRLWKQGHTIILSQFVIENVVGPMSIGEHITHQIRWARTYRASRPKGFAGYGITHIVPFSLLLIAIQGPTTMALLLLCAALALRYSMAVVLYRTVIRMKNWLKWLVLVPVKDVLSFGIWGWSFISRDVSWGDIRYRIVKGGKIKEKA